MEVIRLLNQYSGVGQLVFAALVAFATVVYVVYTARMWREMKMTNERFLEPSVQVVLEPGRKWGSLFELAVRNVGNVPVSNLRLAIEPRDLPYMSGQSIMEKPIPSLAQGQEIRTRIFRLGELIEKLGEDNLLIRTHVTYATPSGATRSQTYEHDVAVYLGLTDFQEKSLSEVVEVLEKSKTTAERIASHLHDVVERLDWHFQYDWNWVRQPVALEELRGRFARAWADFKLEDRPSHLYPARLRMISLLVALYDAACASTASSAELRAKLLAMIERRFMLDGGRSVHAFVEDGDEVLRLRQRQRPRSLTSSAQRLSLSTAWAVPRAEPIKILARAAQGGSAATARLTRCRFGYTL